MAKGKGTSGGDELEGVLQGKNAFGEELEDLAKRFGKTVPGLTEALKDLKDTAKTTDKEFKKAVKTDRVTTKAATTAFKRMQRAIERLKKQTEKATAGQVVTAKQLQKLVKPIKSVTAAITDERKVIKKTTKSRLEQLKEFLRADAAETRARQRERMEKAKEAARDKAAKAAGAAKDRAHEGLRDIGRGGGLGTGRLGSGVLGGLAGAGIVGAAIAAILAGVTHAFNAQRRSVIQATEWMLNYGDSTRTAAEEAGAFGNKIKDAGDTAARMGADVESVQAAVNKIFTETGATQQQIMNFSEESMRTLINVSKETGLTVETVADQVVDLANSSKQSVDAVIQGMEDVAKQARITQKKTGLAVTMRGFKEAVDGIRQSVDALNFSQKGLAKTLRFSLEIAGKVGLATETALRAGRGLVQGLVNEDEGFATVNVESNLRAASKEVDEQGRSTERAKQSQQILEGFLNGRYTADIAAKFFKQTGGSTTQEAMGNVLVNLFKQTGGVAEPHMLEAMGLPADFGTQRIVENIFDQMRAGTIDVNRPEDIIKSLSEEDREDFKRFQQEVAEKGKDPLEAIGTKLDTIFTTLSNGFPKLIETIDRGITSILDALDRITQYLPGADKAQAKAAAEKAIKATAERKVLNSDLATKDATLVPLSLTGGSSAMYGQEATEFGSPAVMNFLRGQALSTGRQQSDAALKASTVTGTPTLTEINQAGLAALEARNAKGPATGQMTLNATGVTAAGEIKVEGTIKTGMGGALQQLQDRAVSTSPQGPGG